VVAETKSLGEIDIPKTGNFYPNLDPNEFFKRRFPEQTDKFGQAFFGTEQLSADFFAAVLRGDKRLGHQVVWYAPEDTFYFHDFRVEAFCFNFDIDKAHYFSDGFFLPASNFSRAVSNLLLRVSSFLAPSIQLTYSF